jgi:hypothetical protein
MFFVPVMRDPLSISELPIDADFQYSDGVLDIVGPDEQMRLKGWHQPEAFWKVAQQDWTPFSPAFPVVRPSESTTRSSDTSSRRKMSAAFDAFRSDLPAEIARTLEPFPGHQWNLLVLIHRKPEALELVQSNPALAWCLANCDEFRSIYLQSAADWAKWHVGNKQIEILEWLGFPGTDSTVKLLRKLAHCCIDPASMRMLAETLRNDEHGTRMLRHQSRINAGALRLCCYRRLTDVISPSLVNEAANDPLEEEDSPRADLLLDTLRLWDTLNLSGSRPVFGSLRRIRKVHDELLLQYQRRLSTQREETRRRRARLFPNPPFPGNDDIIPLCGKSELEKESKEQTNCVGSYYRQILKTQDLFVYKVLRPQRATLALLRSSDGTWRRSELKGAGNQPVRPDTSAAVDSWLKKHLRAW